MDARRAVELAARNSYAIHYAKVAEVMMQLRFWLQVAPLQANHITY